MKKQITAYPSDVSESSHERHVTMLLDLSSQGVSYIEKWATRIVFSQLSAPPGEPIAIMSRQRAKQLSEICGGRVGDDLLGEFLARFIDALNAAEIRRDSTSQRLFDVTLFGDIHVAVSYR